MAKPWLPLSRGSGSRARLRCRFRTLGRVAAAPALGTRGGCRVEQPVWAPARVVAVRVAGGGRGRCGLEAVVVVLCPFFYRPESGSGRVRQRVANAQWHHTETCSLSAGPFRKP